MITYCTNIHPGKSWDETFRNLCTHLLEVKKAVAPYDRFPIGLRLSNQASLEINESISGSFHEWCLKNNCFVPTINGFPYGSFHSNAIKEDVYLPDWRTDERTEYTKRLAVLLDTWLPKGQTGSISTVPIGFKGHIQKEDLKLAKMNLINVLEHLDRLKQKSGKEIILSLEPEPGCVLETTSDVIELFEQMEFPDELKECIGICFDCCHQAVEFEDAKKSLSAISEAGIRIGKIQLSSALRLTNVENKVMKKFSEPCYLHQVVIKQEGKPLIRYNDLPDALNNHRTNTGEEWRIHFHVPVFLDKIENYGTTSYFIEDVLSVADKNILLEVETYTWNVLPPELQTSTVTESIIREILWVRSKIDE